MSTESSPVVGGATRPATGATTKAEALAAFRDHMAGVYAAHEAMTPREAAEAAWTPTSTRTVDQIEDDIRAKRGLPRRHARAS